MFQTNYKELLQIAHRNRTLVPFVGAGFSVAFQMPNWSELLKDLTKEYFSYPIDKNKFDTALSINQYLDAIDCIIDAGVDELDLQRSVAKVFQDKVANISVKRPDNNYIDLSRAKCAKYLTTNYDNILSYYIGQPPRRIEMLGEDFINEWDSGHYDQFVFNIHGDYTNPGSIILSRESYTNLYSDEKYKNILEMFKYKYTFIFLGFSMDDEFVQGIFSKELSKFPTRHYIVLSNIDEEKRRSIEKNYNVRVISYTAETNEDHIKNIRCILEDIYNSEKTNVAERIMISQVTQDNGLLSLDSLESKNEEFSQGDVPLEPSSYELISGDKSDCFSKLDEIEEYVKNESYSFALNQYLLLQSELFGVKVPYDINLRICKGILICRISLKKYDEVQRMLPQIYMFEKGSFETQLYPLLIDFFMNTKRYDEALKAIQECQMIEPSNVVYTGMFHYINAIKEDKGWDEVRKFFVDDDWNLIITADVSPIVEERDKAYLFRLLGEIALIRNEHLIDAKKAFEISFEYEVSTEVLEDLGIVMYALAITKADDGRVIQIEKINQKSLKEAIEYFNSALDKAEDCNMVLSRIAPIYLRSLFYIGNYGRFDNIVELCYPYLHDEVGEISRMQAIVCVALGKSSEKSLTHIKDEDKRIIEYHRLFKEGDYQAVLEYGDNNTAELTESDYYALLDAAFFSKDLKKYNYYYNAFVEKFPNSANRLIVEAFKCEINSQLNKAEKYFIESAKTESPMTINVLLEFYKRRCDDDAVNKIYEELLGNESLCEIMNYAGIYFSYHKYLMNTGHREKAVWLYINRGKDKLSIDIEHAILIDLKIYLHDGNDLIVYCLEMDAAFHKYGEKMYNYYAAIGYLMEADLTNARRYIDKYRKDGYTDDRSIQLIKEFEARLLVLEGKRDPVKKGEVHIIKEFVEKVYEPNNMVHIHPDNHECCVMDSTALYLYISRGMKQELNLVKKIIVSHSSIELIQFAFMETGDKVLLEVLKYIIESSNIVISSPSIERYAVIRKCFRFDSNDMATLSTNASIALALDKQCGYMSAFRVFKGVPETIRVYLYEFLEKNMAAVLKNMALTERQN